MTTLTNVVGLSTVLCVNESRPDNFEVLGTLSKNFRFPEILTPLLQVSPKISRVSRFPAKSSDSPAEEFCFSPETVLNNVVYIVYIKSPNK